MPVIAIDGNEKAGKTTIILSLLHKFNEMGVRSERVHWGPVSPDDREYSYLLKQHTTDYSKVWVWDRCWVSEYVYGNLLHRDHRGAEDPWLLEWLHGRAVQLGGSRVMILGPDPDELARLRDESDLAVDPASEQLLYKKYAQRFGWTVINNQHNKESLDASVNAILSDFMSKDKYVMMGMVPPKYAGDPEAVVAVVGEALSSETILGGWLPFTSNFTTRFGREFGDDAFNVLWTNAADCDARLLSNRKIVITCGKIAGEWYMDTRKEVVEGQKVVNIPHPSYLYRYNNPKVRGQLESVRQVLQALKPIQANNNQVIYNIQGDSNAS